MISGREALGSIDQALNQAYQQIAGAESQIAETTERLIMAQKEQADEYRNLAHVRLDRLSDPDLVQHMDHADRQAVALLENRRDAITGLHSQLAEAERLREQHEAERKHQSVQLDGAVAVVDEAEARTQSRLNDDPPYRAQRELAEQAERKALHAAEKAARSEEELEHKGEAYRQDPLFQYLWKRSFGLPTYDAGGLIRWLDGKVARLIGFADARANYSRLKEIPQRLREHADHLRGLADQEYSRLKQLDEVARAADGVPALEERVAEQQHVLDQIDERIQQGEQDHEILMRRKAEFATGDDEFTRKAVGFLANEFRRDDLVELRRDAINTPFPEDDLIVSHMLQREDEQDQLEQTVSALKGVLEKHQNRLVELESLRKDFKRKRFDRTGSQFADNSMIGVMLGQFLAGMLDRGMLWKVLQEQQRYRPRRSDPGFGSGGFGRGTVWKGGMGDLGDIIGGLGRGGFGGRGGMGGGGGGFRTGGGF